MQIFSIMKITDLDFGSIPDWLGAIGTIGAVWVALWQTTGGFKKQQKYTQIIEKRKHLVNEVALLSQNLINIISFYNINKNKNKIKELQTESNDTNTKIDQNIRIIIDLIFELDLENTNKIASNILYPDNHHSYVKLYKDVSNITTMMSSIKLETTQKLHSENNNINQSINSIQQKYLAVSKEVNKFSGECIKTLNMGD
ncbi:hypothetical protein QMA51_10790 [Leuconostoc suionicum]|uniref:hypothetical protein n=1 Tax=Leuconostoc suionicum TaxID=1511761 RepID=UPI0024ACEDFE|nr:hypothetical protein [Leuconostoc suionicum]MDI6552121.1 hypothetical protein [Leuconostoc suionicum]